MHFRTVILSVDNTAGIPKGPSGQGGCSGDARGVSLQEVEPICGAFIRDATKESEKGEEDGACNENQ